MVSTGKKTSWFMGCGSVLIVIGAIMVIFWPTLFFSQLKKIMIVTEDSMSFSIWRETPIPMYLETYFFNITNVDEILNDRNGSVKLKVKEIGPYVYREQHIKTNLTWNDNNTVTFYNERYWHFVPEMSVGPISDEITSINPIIATVAYIMRHRGTLINFGVDAFLKIYHSNLFLTANVSSWLFDGIEDPIIDMAEKLPIPVTIPFDRFGWFYMRNGSIDYDGSFNMNTGAEDFSRLGNVEQWKFSNRTPYRDSCGEVKGSTGELWAPELGQEEVFIFASDLCTYLSLAKDKEVTVEGVLGVQYSSNDSVFDNGYKYPSMACYCDEVRDQNCLPSGALNVSMCRYGAPAFVSLPHFLHADPYYPSKIDGLSPNANHTFRLALEMYTGMPLSVSAQLQINLLVRHVGGISINNVFPDSDVLVPMFWFRQEVMMTPEYARQALFALNMRDYMPIAFYGMTVIGVLLMIPGVFILMKKLLSSPSTAPILDDTASDE